MLKPWSAEHVLTPLIPCPNPCHHPQDLTTGAITPAAIKRVFDRLADLLRDDRSQDHRGHTFELTATSRPTLGFCREAHVVVREIGAGSKVGFVCMGVDLGG